MAAEADEAQVDVWRTTVPWSQLWRAAFHGELVEVERLLAAGASPDAGVGQHGAAPALMQAAKKGHTHVLEALLRAGATLGARDSGGSTALMWAARFGKPNCVAALLGLGAD